MIGYIDATSLFYQYIASYCAPDTIKYYKLNLRLFSDYLCSTHGDLNFSLDALSKNDFIGYIVYLRSKNIKNTSVRTYARAIKVFLRYLFFEGYLDENITEHVKYPKPDKKIVIPLTNKRVDALVEGIKRGRFPARNMLIFSLMLDCGLRCGEVVALNVADIDFKNDFIGILNSKNNKSRTIPMPAKVRRYVLEYLDTRLCDNSALVLDCHSEQRITENSIKLLFSRLKQYDSEIHAHLLRHTFATSFIMGGGSLEILRVLMGHEDYAVTKEYIHIASQMGVLNYDIYQLDGVVFNRYSSYRPK